MDKTTPSTTAPITSSETPDPSDLIHGAQVAHLSRARVPRPLMPASVAHAMGTLIGLARGLEAMGATTYAGSIDEARQAAQALADEYGRPEMPARLREALEGRLRALEVVE